MLFEAGCSPRSRPRCRLTYVAIRGTGNDVVTVCWVVAYGDLGEDEAVGTVAAGQACVVAGAGEMGLGRCLRKAAERGGWARMWSRTRVMMSLRWYRSSPVRGSNSRRRMTWTWPGRRRPTRARPLPVMVTSVAR